MGFTFIIGMILAMVALAVIIGLIISIPIWLLWNWLMPQFFGLPELALWHVWGFMTLIAMISNIVKGNSSKN